MNYSTLAKELRARLIKRRLVEKKIVMAVPDIGVIDSYITCSSCGEKSVKSKIELDEIVLSSKSVEDFLDKTQINCAHVCAERAA